MSLATACCINRALSLAHPRACSFVFPWCQLDLVAYRMQAGGCNERGHEIFFILYMSIHTYIHTHTHIYAHTYARTQTHTYAHTHINTRCPIQHAAAACWRGPAASTCPWCGHPKKCTETPPHCRESPERAHNYCRRAVRN